MSLKSKKSLIWIFCVCVTLVILLACIVAIEYKRFSVPIVQTDKGQVQGDILKTILNHQPYYSFRGIPYATPPVGSLRFKPPIEAKPWTGIKQTINDGSQCVQVYNNLLFGSEDCLFLNVFTPEIDVNNLKSVMIIIHGGQHKYGSASLFAPDFFIEEDVVFVAMNFRVGALGYLRLDHSDILGNAGLKDQVLAMQWVKNNIKNFGGDPERVTIIGHSSGSICVDLHIVSDLSKGLFHRSIAVSGSILSSWGMSTPEEARERAFKLGSLLNNNQSLSNVDDLVSILQKADATDIVLKANSFPQLRPFKPSVENPNIAKNESKFLSDCFIDKFLTGNYSKLPHIAEFAADENLYHLLSAQLFNALKRETYDYVKNYEPFSSIIRVNIRNQTTADNYSSKDSLKRLIDVLTNINYVAGHDLKQKIMTQTGTQSYYYLRYAFDAKEYSNHRTYNITVLDGASHTDSKVMFLRNYKQPLKDHPVALKRNQLLRLYTNFVKYGNPTPDGENDPLLRITWPASGKNGAHLDFGDELIVKPYSPGDFETKKFEEILYDKLQDGICCNSTCKI
ncbi:esterase FE4-like [Contarinia nasturtii]|uniref:esterase FE4-like n=1 Tax=Contarinia nasturtii TaxID=265458 RepID=UPI0012D48D6D|nr:esterase FE4-like [Contarinia nasturtii]